MIHTGDVVTVLRGMRANSFDACLTDPPYGLSADSRPLNSATPRKKSRDTARAGFMGMQWDARVPGPEVWAEVLRVLKPGAFLLAFGGTRTHHRLMCAIEDAGFEIRDCMMWLHGQGFPKSLDVSKAIDKAAGAERQVVAAGAPFGVGSMRNRSRVECGYRPTEVNPLGGSGTITAPATDAAKLWDGYGTALKPAWEPIIVALKPCAGTFAENAIAHGVAGLNIEAGRIGTAADMNPNDFDDSRRSAPNFSGILNGGKDGQYRTQQGEVPNGRWPANVILDEEAAALLDEQSGILTSGNNPAKRSSDKHRDVYAGWKGAQCLVRRGTDSGGASRFFYCAKASRKERGEGNTHPTVKPLKLCQYLATLLLPPPRATKRRLLIPFAGSGSEIIGARRAGWDDVVGIELNPQYVKMAEERLKTHAQKAAAA